MEEEASCLPLVEECDPRYAALDLASEIISADDGNDRITVVAPAWDSQVTLLRRRAVEFARRYPLTVQDLADVELAVGEACSNALRHGSPHPDLDSITLRCCRIDSTLSFEISDCGPGFDPARVPAPAVDDLDEGGMGIFVMRSLMDSVEFRFEHGTTVCLCKRLGSSTP